MGGVNGVQVGVHSGDHQLVNGLPLIIGDELPVLMLDTTCHRWSRFIPWGHPHRRVALGVCKGPKDQLRIVGGALGWTRLRERERWPDSRGHLGGRVTQVQSRGSSWAGDWGSYKKCQ